MKQNLHQLGLALAVFLLSQLLVAVVIYITGNNYFNSYNWLRWDSDHYLKIAEKGYEFFPCAGKFGNPDTSKDFCGNTGWFPGYPMLIRFSAMLFKDSLLVAGILSKIFYFFILFAVLKVSKISAFS